MHPQTTARLSMIGHLLYRLVLRLNLASISRKLEFFASTKYVSDLLAIWLILLGYICVSIILSVAIAPIL